MPANEVFEAVFYLSALTNDQMVNVTSNMTYFFDKNGSLPAIPVYAAYSLRRLFPVYTGPVLSIIRQSDSLQADLFADEFGSFTKIITFSQPSSTITDSQ
jgi:hypothetical protein